MWFSQSLHHISFQHADGWLFLSGMGIWSGGGGEEDLVWSVEKEGGQGSGLIEAPFDEVSLCQKMQAAGMDLGSTKLYHSTNRKKPPVRSPLSVGFFLDL